jgi:3-methyladenine DNA glycosylase AlkD
MKNSTAQVLSVDQVAERIATDLRKMRDSRRAQGSQRYFKESIVALGIAAPALRNYMKDQVNLLKGSWTLIEALHCCERLLAEPELEIRAAGFLLLGAFNKKFTLELTAPAHRWLEKRLDNWALVDGFCGTVLSPWLGLYPEVVSTLRRWSAEKSLWVRRAAIVTLVPFARRGQHLDLVYDLACRHFPDTEDLMHKAVGWLLREAGKTDMQRLRHFLLLQGPAIPRTALRYAIERFPAQEKKQLLLTTRG